MIDDVRVWDFQYFRYKAAYKAQLCVRVFKQSALRSAPLLFVLQKGRFKVRLLTGEQNRNRACEWKVHLYPTASTTSEIYLNESSTFKWKILQNNQLFY